MKIRSLKTLVLLSSLMIPVVMVAPASLMAQEAEEQSASDKLKEVESYLEQVDSLLNDLKSKPADQLNAKTDYGVPANVILELQSARDQINRQLKKFKQIDKGDSQWGKQGAWRELEAAMPLLESRYEKAQDLKDQLS